MNISNENDESYLEETQEQLRDKAGQDIYIPVEWMTKARELFGRSLNDKIVGIDRRVAIYPFSFNRQAAAERLGITSRARIESTVLVLFLCCCEFDEIDQARGGAWEDGKWINYEREFRRKMNEWAEAIGIRLNSSPEKEARKIVKEIWARLDACNGEPQVKGTTGTPNPNG